MSRITSIILRSADENVADQVLKLDKVWQQFTSQDNFEIHEIDKDSGLYKLSVAGKLFNAIDSVERISFDEDGEGDPVIIIRGTDPIYTYPKRITPLLHQHATTRSLRITWQMEAMDVIISSMFYDDVRKLKEIILVRGE